MENLITDINVNFGEFYNSIHSGIIDTNVELMEYDWENINHRAIFEIYAKDYIKALNNKLDTNISFKALIGPKFYNYLMGYINVEITKKDILKLFKYIKEEELKEEVINIIKDNSTSKSGYIAFYEYKDFFKKENLDILIECLFDVIIENMQDGIIEELQGNYINIILNENN